MFHGPPEGTLPLVIYMRDIQFLQLLQYNMSFVTISGGFNPNQPGGGGGGWGGG